jgi:hypothetical protein
MIRIGPKTREWQRVRAQLKPRFKRAGITRCEFRFEGCWRDNSLGFAHPRKRRNLRPGELEVVALACGPCHDKLELMPEPVMYLAVTSVITKRRIQP